MLPEVELEAGTLVIADLHLDVEDGPSLDAFEEFLGRAAGAPRLVILGDLFEVWVGPAQTRTAGGRRVLGALARCAAGGTRVDVIPGNRDFLLDEHFERASGGRVRRAGLLGRLPGAEPSAPQEEIPGTPGDRPERVLLIHGDELATRDRAYQRLRRVLRSRPLTWLAPRLPLFVSLAIARRLRRASTRAVQAKPAPEKALQPTAGAELAGLHGAGVVVCGHAHEFRDEALPGGGRWVVLDAFGGARDLLRVAGEGGLEALSSRIEPVAG